MPNVNLPLSGAVTQLWKTWVSAVAEVGSQFGLINVVIGRSSNPQAEDAVVSEVASYGRQLGRVEDALEVLIRRLVKATELGEAEKRAITDFQSMYNEIADVRQRHSTQPVLRPTLTPPAA